MDNQRNILFNKALNLDKHRSVPRNRLLPSLPQDSEMLILPQPNNEKGKRTQCRWDDDMVKNLVEIMVEIVTTCGKRSDNGNKKDVYLAVANEMQKRGFDVDKDNVANKLKAMKKEYNVAVETKRKSGFEFDTMRKVIVADPLAWAGWVKERPAARNLRTKWLQYFDECEVIFGNDYATGSGQFALGDSRSESEIGESEVGMENASVDVDDTEVDHVPCQASNTSTSNGGTQKTNGETQKTGPNVNKRKRTCSSSDDPALLIMQKMVDVTEKIGRSLERPSMKDLNEALKAVPNLEKKHVRKAYNMLGKDQQLAEMFFGCDLEERKEWVLEILGEEE